MSSWWRDQLRRSADTTPAWVPRTLAVLFGLLALLKVWDVAAAEPSRSRPLDGSLLVLFLLSAALNAAVWREQGRRAGGAG